MSKSVAALFIDPAGPYPALDGVDCWGADRDARRYWGPHAVVAHPPCQLWVNFAALNFKRYGGEHNRPGYDGGCFASALHSVLRWGGVLEHPASSRAYAAHGLIAPTRAGWNPCGIGWTGEVWQSAYGHKARKRTWLLYVGHPRPFELDWSRKSGTHQCGWFDRLKPTLSKKEASRTPLAFARLLVALARHSRAHATVPPRSSKAGYRRPMRQDRRGAGGALSDRRPAIVPVRRRGSRLASDRPRGRQSRPRCMGA